MFFCAYRTECLIETASLSPERVPLTPSTHAEYFIPSAWLDQFTIDVAGMVTKMSLHQPGINHAFIP